MKLKTKKAAAKRFSLTATGKVKYKKAGLRHILARKSSKLKRGRGAAGILANRGDAKHVIECLPYGA